MPPAQTSSPVAAPRPDHRTTLASALAAVVALLLALWIPVHLSFPLGRDQAIIARVAQTLVEGGWPYVDAWDHKGPAAYLLYAPFLALLGPAEVALYRADLLLLALLFLAYRALARRIELPLAAPLALLALVLCVRNGHWTLAQPDTWIGYLAVAVAALLLSPRLGLRPATLAAAGAAIGFAAMVKPLFAGFLVLPATALLTVPRAQWPRGAVALVGLGFAAVIAATALPFVLAGHGQALWDAYVAFNVGGHVTRTWQDPWEWLSRFFGTFIVPRMHVGMAAILIAAVAGFVTLLRRHRRVALVLGAGWLVALPGVAIQGKAFPYHFMAVHGFTAVFAAAFAAARVDALGEALRDGRGRAELRRHAAMTGLLLGGIYAAMLPHATRTADWWAMQAGKLSRDAFEQELCEVDYCVPRLRGLGAVVRDFSAADEPIFVWGFDSAVYIFAERRAASRFGFSYPLIGGSPAWRARVRAELMESLGARMPPLIVVQTNDYIRLMASRPSSAHLAEFPELAALIRERYARSLDLGDFVVYRRRD